jgi:hypothetical protein
MKTARFLSTLAGFGALTLGLSLAGEPSGQPSAKGPSKDQVADIHQAPGQQRGDNTQTKRASVSGLHQPGLNQPVTAAKAGAMMNKTGNPREQLARPPLGTGTTGTTTSLPGVVHGRGAATASLGGLVPSSAKSSAAVINGTGMKPKP